MKPYLNIQEAIRDFSDRIEKLEREQQMEPFVMIQDVSLYSGLEVEFRVEGANASEIADQVSLRISEFFEGRYPPNLQVKTSVRPLAVDGGKVTTWTATARCTAS